VPKKEKTLTAFDELKLEIAEEIGLLDKVRTEGWAKLSAQEAGFLGGMISKRLREQGVSARDLK
jgi:hypothetical protein